MTTHKSTHSTPRFKNRGMPRVDTERRFFLRAKARSLASPNVSNPKILKHLYWQMLRIRLVEETIAYEYSKQEMRCPVHLCIGQEAVAAGVCSQLVKNDFVLGTHRAHGYYLAKGGNLSAMFAEIYGKETGCAKGRGGSMHLIDLSVGFLGSTPIVANSIPVATGVALAEKLCCGKKITVVFFGDAAVEEGAFAEALNFAVLKKLPIIYVCENNLYSVYTPIKLRQPKRNIADIARGYGATAFSGDGNDILEVIRLTRKALTQIKQGCGPVFLEFATYRWREHCGPNYDNHLGYRTETEFKKWQKLDPVGRFSKYLIRKKLLRGRQLASLKNQIDEEVTKELNRAKHGSLPKPVNISDVYAR